MSKSLRRVENALVDAGVEPHIRQMPDATRTAAQAAAVVGCTTDQIAKSIIFLGTESGAALLFLTAGGQQVDTARAQALSGEALEKADAALIRAQTGFAIGGVAPIGHLTRPRAWFDRRLFDFSTVWAAAGTPHHVFSIPPDTLARISHADPADFTL